MSMSLRKNNEPQLEQKNGTFIVYLVQWPKYVCVSVRLAVKCLC